MNSVANGKIRERTGFRDVFIQPAAGDNGTALGAAFDAWHQASPRPRAFVMEHGYWGPAFSDAQIAATLDGAHAGIQASGCVRRELPDEQALTDWTARQIADGRVVGWFQGRMEWGARALGNRSILADPRRADMRDIINTRIKFRERFRPFAPSILEEAVDEYFVDGVIDPFMLHVYPIRPEKRGLVPAITHVDGSGRLQTVSRRSNPLYWTLITAFQTITGVPMLLNTSFNENEPIVLTPAEALDCFLRTNMDVLVLGRHVQACPRRLAARRASASKWCHDDLQNVERESVLLQSLLLARRRRDRPAADRARRGPRGRVRLRGVGRRGAGAHGRQAAACRGGASCGTRRTTASAFFARTARGSAAPLRRPRAQLPQLLSVGGGRLVRRRPAGRGRVADRSADHRAAGALDGAAHRREVRLSLRRHLSRSRGAARGLPQRDGEPRPRPHQSICAGARRCHRRARRSDAPASGRGKGRRPARDHDRAQLGRLRGDRAGGQGQPVRARTAWRTPSSSCTRATSACRRTST